MADDTYSGWSILELMGHRRLAGMVSEATIGGSSFIRIDVPGGVVEAEALDGPDTIATQFYSPSAVYCITPTTEDIARAVAASNRPTPVSRWECWELPAARDEAAEPDYIKVLTEEWAEPW